MWPLLCLVPAIKPSVSRNDAAKQDFNKVHAGTRQCIERAFGLLKARFRKLLGGLEVSMEVAQSIIAACFIFHNISEFKGFDKPSAAEIAAVNTQYRVAFPRDNVAADALEAGGSEPSQGIRNALVLHIASLP